MTEPSTVRTTPVILAARRTPIGSQGGALRSIDAASLAAGVLAGLRDDLTTLGVNQPVDDVVLGNTRGPGGNLARVAALAAGLGVGVAGLTVDRQCGSGQAAVQVAADQIAAGSAGLLLAGGTESASTQPVTSLNGKPYTRAAFAPLGFPDPEMGPAAQLVADAAKISREAQDRYAVRSHELSLASMPGETAELVQIAGLAQDERPRKLKYAVLQRFPGVFGGSGSITTGNSCGVSDAAAAVALSSEATRRRLAGFGEPVPGLALRGWVSVGVDPATPGLGPVAAVATLLKRSGVSLAQVDRFEIVEAFAGQVLACTTALGLDPLGADQHRVCVQGGAIARGHPWGASGAMLLVRLFDQLVRRPGPYPGPGQPRLGLATCAIGGGQGVALLVERVG